MLGSKHTTHATRLAVVTTMAVASVALAGSAGAATPRTLITWHMDEASGSSMLDSTGHHPGTLKSVKLRAAGDPAFATAGASFGYTFNGTSAKVTIPNASDLNPQNDDVHIAFSMRTTKVPATPDYDLFRKGTSPQQLFKVELQPNGQVSCGFKGSSSSTTLQAGPDVHDGAWHRIGCAKTATSVILTVDGKSFTKSKRIGSISNTANMIVASHGSGEFYPGDMDELVYQIG